MWSLIQSFSTKDWYSAVYTVELIEQLNGNLDKVAFVEEVGQN